MKRYRPTIAIIAIIAFCFFLLGCNKLLDYFHKHPDAAVKGCSIEKIDMVFKVATFYNNRLGDPDSILFSNTNQVVKHEFRYDNRHRITDFIRIYTNNFFETWNRFIYDASGKIIRDTIYVLGGIVGTDPVDLIPGLIRVTTYEYDDQKRIVKTTESYPFPDYPTDDAIVYYTYDASGNLVKPGIVYDNQINIHRTNKIWMLIDKDYSVNNPFIADAYNSSHLPTKVSSGLGEQYKAFIWFTPFREASITYSCK